MRYYHFLLLPTLLFFITNGTNLRAQDSTATRPQSGDSPWSLSAQFLIGASMPNKPARSSGSSVQYTSATGTYSSGGPSSSGGVSAENMTWSYALAGTLYWEFIRSVHAGWSLGYDRLSRTSGRRVNDVFYDRLHAYYLKTGPQLTLMERKNNRGLSLYLGLNIGIPLTMDLAGEHGTTTFTSDSTTWDTMVEIQGGMRIYLSRIFNGYLRLNFDVGYGLNPLYSYDNGEAHRTMIAFRAGLSYDWEL